MAANSAQDLYDKTVAATVQWLDDGVTHPHGYLGKLVDELGGLPGLFVYLGLLKHYVSMFVLGDPVGKAYFGSWSQLKVGITVDSRWWGVANDLQRTLRKAPGVSTPLAFVTETNWKEVPTKQPDFWRTVFDARREINEYVNAIYNPSTGFLPLSDLNTYIHNPYFLPARAEVVPDRLWCSVFMDFEEPENYDSKNTDAKNGGYLGMREEIFAKQKGKKSAIFDQVAARIKNATWKSALIVAKTLNAAQNKTEPKFSKAELESMGAIRPRGLVVPTILARSNLMKGAEFNVLHGIVVEVPTDILTRKYTQDMNSNYFPVLRSFGRWIGAWQKWCAERLYKPGASGPRVVFRVGSEMNVKGANPKIASQADGVARYRQAFVDVVREVSAGYNSADPRVAPEYAILPISGVKERDMTVKQLSMLLPDEFDGQGRPTPAFESLSMIGADSYGGRHTPESHAAHLSKFMRAYRSKYTKPKEVGILIGEFGVALQHSAGWLQHDSDAAFARGWYYRAFFDGVRAVALDVAGQYDYCPEMVVVYFNPNKAHIEGMQHKFWWEGNYAFTSSWKDFDSPQSVPVKAAKELRFPIPAVQKTGTNTDFSLRSYPAWWQAGAQSGVSMVDLSPEGSLRRFSEAATGASWEATRQSVYALPVGSSSNSKVDLASSAVIAYLRKNPE